MKTAKTNRRHSKLSAAALLLLCGAAAAAGWFGLQIYPLHRNTTFQVAGPCKVCGHVERVRELERASHAALNGDQCESIVKVIAALGSRIAHPGAASSFRTFETAVRLDDGSIRVVRDSTLPFWKQGDRVRVMRGRVEPMG